MNESEQWPSGFNAVCEHCMEKAIVRKLADPIPDPEDEEIHHSSWCMMCYERTVMSKQPERQK